MVIVIVIVVITAMIITYHGENYFKLQSGNLTVLTDPTNLRSVKGADVILSTRKPGEIGASGDSVWIDRQGEYEIKNMRIRGWSAGGDRKYERTAYLLKMDEMKIAILGALEKELNQETIRPLKDCHIAIAPAGGKPCLDAGAAARMLKTMGSGVIIPSLFRDLKPFLREFKKTSCEPREKLVIKANDIKLGNLEIVCLAF